MDHLKIGITNDAIATRASRGLSWQVGQMYGVLGPGLIFAKHVFQGLKRGMYVRNDTQADAKKLAVSWDANEDAQWVGGPHDGTIEFCPSPDGSVFVVYISPNQMIQQFPDIYGWAEHWTWVAGDPSVPGAPIESETRYETRLWSSG